MVFTVKDIKNLMNDCSYQLGRICTIQGVPEILAERDFDLEGFLGKTAQCLARSAHILSLVIENTKVDFNIEV